MHTPPGKQPPGKRSAQDDRVSVTRGRRRWHRRATAAAGLAAAGLAVAAMVTAGDAALAAPAPTVSQVRAKLAKLNTNAERLDQKLDQAQQQLQAASSRLTVVNGQVARLTKQFDSMRTQIGRIAAQVYMSGQLSASVQLLTSGRPQDILSESSILTELSSSNDAQMKLFLAAARRLEGAQQAAVHTKQGIAGLKKSLTGQKATLAKLIGQQQSLLARLTPAQSTGLGPGGGGGASPPPAKYTGPTGTQAQKAVAFAYAQLGCPYVFGGTGPCHSGFDCSGLTSQAWASAGISIGRTSYAQWDSLPHVALADIQPGDILVYAGASHVGIYVGGGFLIDAPHTGLNVEKVAMSGWYKTELIGAVRP